LNTKEAKVTKAFDVTSAERFRLARRSTWASRLETLLAAVGDNPFSSEKKLFFASFASFLFKNLFAYFCLDVFFWSDHERMKVAVL
jgi:hypothetical protein